MNFEKGLVVRMEAGRDSGRFFVVLSAQQGWVLLADGKRRPLEKPKRKNVKHIRKTSARLEESSLYTNRKLREALCAFRSGEGGKTLV